MMKIYHNSKCSKSRCSYELLKESGVAFETVEYLKNPLTKVELIELLIKLNISGENLIRKGETDYIKNFKGKKLSELEWIDAMVKYPKLIERPIIVKGDKAVIGRPIEKVIQLISE
ncbi:MAG: arsenate reductase (glutaredoxin) [Flavobacteriaceae bacterium]